MERVQTEIPAGAIFTAFPVSFKIRFTAPVKHRSQPATAGRVAVAKFSARPGIWSHPRTAMSYWTVRSEPTAPMWDFVRKTVKRATSFWILDCRFWIEDLTPSGSQSKIENRLFSNIAFQSGRTTRARSYGEERCLGHPVARLRPALAGCGVFKNCTRFFCGGGLPFLSRRKTRKIKNPRAHSKGAHRKSGATTEKSGPKRPFFAHEGAVSGPLGTRRRANQWALAGR